jgi:hypothetical protein
MFAIFKIVGVAFVTILKTNLIIEGRVAGLKLIESEVSGIINTIVNCTGELASNEITSILVSRAA